MLDDVLSDLKNGIEKAMDALKRELSRLRTGRASLAVLEGVRIDYYGVPTPLNQMTSMSTPDPRTILIKPWDRSQVKLVEKAIHEANLGFTPNADGDFIRISVPPLTEDRRRELVKVIKKHGEETKVAIRGHRRDANEMVKAFVDSGDVPEDDGERTLKKVQEIIDLSVKKVDDVVAAKEKDVLEV